MKYIDADRLKAEIERLKDKYPSWQVKSATDDICCFIDSLQQEQPEVDLEEEVKQYFQGLWPGMETAEQCNTDLHFTPIAIMRLATHFYEFGLKVKEN